ncbi:MAG TPA: CrcB family protein, partial [Pseudonocardiaceae bacterium]|nr:CrcB family protein [Pseudonocardiaceae bacterium]
GGFAGAVARQVLSSALQDRARTRFPVGILVVNLSGAFAPGLLYGIDIENRWPDWLRAVTHTGLIGAYTTYSTWAVDCLALTRGGQAGRPWSTWRDRWPAACCWLGAARGSARPYERRLRDGYAAARRPGDCARMRR